MLNITDEETHKRIFQYLLKQSFKDPFFSDVSKQMLVDHAGHALELENVWCKEIFAGDIDEDKLELHNAWRMNTLLASLGLEKLNTSLSNPLKRLYDLGFEGDGSGSRSNVLEIKSANYSNADMLEFEF